jgi:hypothetical protein
MERNTSGSNGAPAANGGGKKGRAAAFTTPVKARETRKGLGLGGGGAMPAESKARGGEAREGGEAEARAREDREGDDGARFESAATAAPHASDLLELAPLPYTEEGVRPLVKLPAQAYLGAYWDGTAPGTDLDLALECMRFWKRLARAVATARWSEELTWVYVSSQGCGGDLQAAVAQLTSMDEVKRHLERCYLRNHSVAEVTAPVYRMAQGRRSVEEYLREGKATWLLVGDLIPSQEAAVVQVWVGALDPLWARRNQAVYTQLSRCSTWDSVDEVLVENRRVIWDLDPPRPGGQGQGGASRAAGRAPVPSTTPPARSDGSGAAASGQTPARGAPNRRNGSGCWICGAADHQKRECPKRQGNGQGGGQ